MTTLPALDAQGPAQRGAGRLPHRRPFAMLVLLAATLAAAGCAAPGPQDPDLRSPYCAKTNKGRVYACTSKAVPSLREDAEAKRFSPEPGSFTVSVVRSSWSDRRNVVAVRANDAPAVETLPDTMVRFRLKPGTHQLALAFDGQERWLTVSGGAGEAQQLLLKGDIWAGSSSYAWLPGADSQAREKAMNTRLVADVDLR